MKALPVDDRSWTCLILRFYPTHAAASEALRRQEVQGMASMVGAGTSVTPPSPATRELLVPLGEYTILTFNLREAPWTMTGFVRPWRVVSTVIR